MKFIARCIDSIERRPIILASLFLFCLIFSCIEQLLYTVYNKLLAFRVSNMFSFLADTNNNTGNLENTMDAAQQAAEASAGGIGSTLITIVLVIVALFILSAIVSVYFSGYFHVLNLSLRTDKEKAKGDFRKGISKHYTKITTFMFSNILIFIAAAIVLAFAFYPTILSFNMVSSGRNDLLAVTIIIFLISVVVVSYIFSIIMMYTLYMYPALTNFKKGAWYMAKKVVKAKFWYIMPRLMGFVVVLGIWQWFLVFKGYGLETFMGSLSMFILNGIIKTYMLLTLFFFVFFTFRQIKNGLQMEEELEYEGVNPSHQIQNYGTRKMEVVSAQTQLNRAEVVKQKKPPVTQSTGRQTQYYEPRPENKRPAPQEQTRRPQQQGQQVRRPAEGRGAPQQEQQRPVQRQPRPQGPRLGNSGQSANGQRPAQQRQGQRPPQSQQGGQQRPKRPPQRDDFE